MKRTIVCAVLLAGAAPAQAVTGIDALLKQPAPIGVVPRAAPPPTALFEDCTREGERKGRYAGMSWCEWFSYFHQFKR